MTHTVQGIGDVVVLVGGQGGHAIIPQPTPLTRLNYYDGKFLRADDLSREQDYVRHLVELSNQAGGAGVVHGFSTRLGANGDNLQLSPGLAIDPVGRVLLLPQAVSMPITEVIAESRRVAGVADRPASGHAGTFEDCVTAAAVSPSHVANGPDLYLVSIAHVEALCGEETAFGSLCDAACATATERPYRLEGIVVRIRPLVLTTPLAASNAVALDQRHLRSLVASAYYADEARRVACLVSKEGLSLDTWCMGAAAQGGSDVPVAVLGRAGSTTTFLDAWTARRERMEAPPRRYWAWRMCMRPWDVFLAEVLQFQCQLPGALRPPADGGPADDPCRPSREVLTDASRFLSDIQRDLGADTPSSNVPPRLLLEQVSLLKSRVESAIVASVPAARTSRLLIEGGIVELPPAGYLPVTPSSTVTVNAQVRRLLGEGLDLRFCVCRPDYVAHALEAAQHLERISLLHGLDHPDAKPAVDVLVPNGRIIGEISAPTGRGFQGVVRVAPQALSLTGTRANERSPSAVAFLGAGRGEVLDTGGFAFHFAGAAEVPAAVNVERLVDGLSSMAKEHVATVGDAVQTPDEEHARTHADPAFTSRVHRLAASGGGRGATGGTAAAPQLAMWTTMRAERDVLALRARGVCPVTFLLDIAFHGDAPAWISYRLRGDIRVDAATATAGLGRLIAGRFDGIGSIRSRLGGSRPREESGAIVRPLTITVEPSGTGLAVVASLDLGNQNFVVTTEWGDRPMKVSMDIDVGQDDQTIGLVAASVDENPAVLEPANSLHTLALSALRVVGASLGDATFAAAAEALLFPPPPQQAAEQTVQATMDWVLFHRRRDKRCGEVQAAVAVPPRRYQVYLAHVADEEQAADVRSALQQGDNAFLVRAEFVAVAQVEFAGGLPALTSSADDLRRAWTASHPDKRVLYGGIATRDRADGDAMARLRLGGLESALAPAATFSGADFEVLAAVPDALSIEGTDGIAAFLTTPVVATTCHSVYGIKPEHLELAVRTLQTDGLVGMLAVEVTIPGTDSHQRVAVPLGTVRFNQDAQEVVSDAGAKQVDLGWKTLVPSGVPTVALALARKAGGGDTGAVMTAARVEAIATLLGGHVDPDVKEIDEVIPGDCPVITLLSRREARVRESAPVTAKRSDQPLPTPDDVAARTAPEHRPERAARKATRTRPRDA